MSIKLKRKVVILEIDTTGNNDELATLIRLRLYPVVPVQIQVNDVTAPRKAAKKAKRR